MNDKTVELMRRFIERVAKAPVELGPPDDMPQALAMFAAMEHQTNAAQILLVLIESDSVTKQ